MCCVPDVIVMTTDDDVVFPSDHTAIDSTNSGLIMTFPFSWIILVMRNTEFGR